MLTFLTPLSGNSQSQKDRYTGRTRFRGSEAFTRTARYPKVKDPSRTATARRPSARTYQHSAPPAPGSCVVQVAGNVSAPKSRAGRSRACLSTAALHLFLKSVAQDLARGSRVPSSSGPTVAASGDAGPSGFRRPTLSQAWSGIGNPRTAKCVRNADVQSQKHR